MKTQALSQPRRGRVPRALDRGLDLAMRIIPVATLVAVGAFFSAQQAVRPSHRAIKALVVMGLMALMFRFDMVYSVYLFAFLFPFPSGISIGSSNNVLMTIIPMIWAVRASSRKLQVMPRTAIDKPVAVFFIAYLISMINVSDVPLLAKSIAVLWRHLAACAFFYTIVLFVDDEAKLFRFCKIMCVACALSMTAAVAELFFPGRMLIPGWIGLTQNLGEGVLSHRLRGLRVGGTFSSHDLLGDYGTQLLLFMVFFFIHARNPVSRVFWLGATAMTVLAVLATANRGAASGMLLGITLGLVYFRRAIGPARMVLIVVLGVSALAVTDYVLSEKTIAISVMDRFAKTRFEGIVPENRTMTWKPALDYGMESPLIGHGPFYDTGVGLTSRYWPHNGYLFYFDTIGLLGLSAFLVIMWRVYRESALWRSRGVRRTNIGNLLALAQIWFFVLSWEQLRTDHQRDDIYPYLVWMCFGVITAAYTIARRNILSAGDGLRGSAQTAAAGVAPGS